MIIYRGALQIADVEIDDSTILKHSLLGEHLINANFTLDEYLDVQVGDHIIFGTVVYTILKHPVVKKSRSNQFVYNIDFMAPQYQYDNALFLFDGLNDFPITGTVETFLSHIRDNMNRVSGGNSYTVGTFPASGFKTINFQQDTCLSALKKVCEAYSLEYKFADDGLSVDVADSIGVATGLSFQFKQGLRNIERREYKDGLFMTRLYPYGSDRNIIFSSYGSKRLLLGTATNYLENNIAQFGTIEKSVIFDDIYPRRESTVTATNAEDVNLFIDSTMDFDLNAQLTSSVAKVTFNSGMLAGYEFEIASYNDGSNQFELIPITDDQDRTLPNSVFKPQIGDSYVIHDIVMPQSYIDAAEAELLARATDYLNTYSQPNVTYEITPDPVYFEQNLISLNVGDLIQITDTDFGITIDTKIIDISKSLANPYKYVVKVGNKAIITRLQTIQIGVEVNADRIVKQSIDRTIDRLRVQKKINDLNTLTDSIFDVDGYFDTEKIKPLSIETGALSVGAKPLNMNFVDLEIEANYLSNANNIRISNSSLVHFTIESTVREWTMTGNTFTIPDNNARYLYAQVSIPNNTGNFVVTTEQRQIDGGPANTYTFLIGVIHAVQSGSRGVSFVYGQTFINGRFITTGKIQSLNGQNYFDLDNNTFFLGNASSSLDWNVTNPNALTIKGMLVQSLSGVEQYIPVHRGEYDNGTEYFAGDTVTYQGSTWMYISGSSTTGNIPAEGSFWTLYAAKGADGADGVDGTGVSIKGTEANAAAIAALPGPHTEGDLYIAADTGNGWVWDGTSFVDVGLIRGPEGPQGLTGPQGVQGPAGADGQTTYTWIKYADDENGSGISNDPTGKPYIGFAYNKTTEIESNDPSQYTWSLIQGTEGVQGPAGADGESLYTWIKYSDFPDGNPMYDVPTANTQYIGIRVNNTTPVESTNNTLYTWSKFKGDQGEQGPQGPVGPQGPAGADGIDGVDGLQGPQGIAGEDGVDGFGAIPHPIFPATLGGFSDAKFFLDQSTEETINTGEIFVRVTSFVDSKQNTKVSSLYRQTVNTPFGEGEAGIFYLMWSDTVFSSRVTLPTGSIDGNIIPVIYESNQWYAIGNGTGSRTPITLVATDVFVCAIEAKQSSGGLTGFLSFLSGAKGLDAVQAGYFYDDFTEYGDTIDFWEKWNYYSGVQSELSLYTGVHASVGGQSILIGNNSGNDQIWAGSKKLLAYDPEDLYQITVKFKSISGNGVVYFGINGYAADKTTLVNIVGENSQSSQHYFAASGINPTEGVETTVVGYFQGIAGDSLAGGQHNDPTDPGQVHEDAKYIAPMFIVNYSGQAGQVVIQSIEIKKINDFSPIPKGNYQSGVTYYRGNVVTWLGSSYIAKITSTNLTPNTNPSAWTLIAQKGDTGPKGDPGDPGPTGSAGPGIVYRGDYSTWTTTVFYNNSVRRDVILRSGTYYYYIGTNGLSNTSFVAGNWASFGSSFSSVATNLLLAENASIADFTIVNGRITSQDSAMTIYGPQGAIIWNTVSVNGSAANTRIAKDGFFISASGVAVDQPTTVYDSNGNPVTTTSFGPRAAVVGKCDWSGASLTPSVGVYGETENQGDNDWGGWFWRLMAEDYLFVDGRTNFGGGIDFKTNRGGGITLNDNNFFYVATSAATIYLPNSSNRRIGQTFIIKRQTTGAVTVSGNGGSLYWKTASSTLSIGATGEAWMITWDGVYWQVMTIFKA